MFDRKNRRYFAGFLMIVLQYIFFRNFAMYLGTGVSLRNLSFFIFTFLYLKEEIYSFKTYLVWEEIKKQVKCLFEYSVLLIIIIFHILGYEEIYKYLLLGSFTFAWSFLLSKIFRKILYRLMKTNLIIYGTGETAEQLTNIIKKNKFTMYDIKGYIFTNLDGNSKVKGKIYREDNLEELFEKEKIDEIIIAIPSANDKEMNILLNKIEGKVERIKFIPKINNLYTFNPQIQDYDGVMLISAKNYMFSTKRKVLKRILDVIGAIMGCTILIPLYLMYGKEIKKTGKKLFFKHNRLGKGLKSFKMYKFRSMYDNAEERLNKILETDKKLEKEFYKTFKLKNDPRVTKIGKFLRKTSLDEFPQFINVIRGEMSLVGPRPVIKKELEMYYGKEVGEKIFQLKPGITGMWQTKGRSDIEDYEERIALDLYYARNWTIWLDIIILIKTIKNVINKKGAY